MRKLVLITLFFCSGFSSAWADTYVIQVRGVIPSTPVKTATCNENNHPCLLSLPLPDGDYIDIAADFSGDIARFEFMQDRNYLSVDNKGGTVLSLPLETSQTVSLLDPQTIEQPGLVQKPVLRQGQPVARLEVLSFRQKP